MPIRFGPDPGPEEIVNHDPLALLIAMLLDQQVPIEWAFAAPQRLVDRLGRPLDAEAIATFDPGAFAAIAAGPPAIHRYHRSMAARVQALCTALVDEYEGRAERLWSDTSDARTVHRRLVALPGFGTEKAQITVAVLAKRFGHRFDHLDEGAGPFADEQPRSVADIAGPESLAAVKAWKKVQRESGRSKADAPAGASDGVASALEPAQQHGE